MDFYDVTIVGGGPSGLFASFYAGMREMRTKLIEALPELGGQLAILYPEKFIYDAPGHPKILAGDLVKYLIEQAVKFGPTFVLNEHALNLKRNEDGIIIETDKDQHFTKTLLITAGVGAFSPNRLGISNESMYEGKGLLYFVKEKSTLRGKRILIVGGGDSAVDWALTLRNWAKEVTLLHRRDTFRAHESSVTELFASDVGLKLFHELREIKGRDKVEEAIIFNNKTGEEAVLDVDAILVNVGFRADLGPIREWGLDWGGRHIKVNQRMETSVKGVYAAGDIATQEGLENLNLIATGFAQAAIAINNSKKFVDPSSSVRPGHSSDMRL